MYRLIYGWCISLSVLSCQQKEAHLPYYNTPDFTPLFLHNDDSIARIATHRIGAFSLLSQDSEIVTQDRLVGKIHVANFIFTSCRGICPSLTKHLKQVSDSFVQDTNFLMLSYSVMPWVDKPFVLKKYRAYHQIKNPRWYFLTGSQKAIYDLARKSYFAQGDLGWDSRSDTFLHTEHCILVDQSKRIRGIYNGTLAVEMDALVQDIKTLQKE